MLKLKPTRGSQIIKSHQLARGLVGLWLFNEAVGNTVFDLSGNGNTGTIIADTHFVPGKFGHALDFDGTGDYVDCGNIPLLVGQNQITISVWIHGSFSGNENDGIVSQVDDWEDGIGIFAGASGNLVIGRIENSNTKCDVTGEITPNVWNHLVLTYNGTDGYFYVNSVQTGTASETVSIPDLTSNMLIGYMTAGEDYYTGLIDNVLIYKRALSASEIALLYREPFSMFERGTRSERFFLPGVVVPTVVARQRSNVGFRPIGGANRLRGLRRNAWY